MSRISDKPKNNPALFALGYIMASGKEQVRTMPCYFKAVEKALIAAERDKARLDWLLRPGSDMSTRDIDQNTYIGYRWFDNRKEIDAAIRSSRGKR